MIGIRWLDIRDVYNVGLATTVMGLVYDRPIAPLIKSGTTE